SILSCPILHLPSSPAVVVVHHHHHLPAIQRTNKNINLSSPNSSPSPNSPAASPTPHHSIYPPAPSHVKAVPPVSHCRNFNTGGDGDRFREMEEVQAAN
ncbi:hypothetical protein LINGRAPRIM_LOCUS1849, partial [Linum grandiflorum]